MIFNVAINVSYLKQINSRIAHNGSSLLKLHDLMRKVRNRFTVIKLGVYFM